MRAKLVGIAALLAVAALAVAAVAAAQGAKPVNQSAPTIEGAAVVGRTIAAGPGIWTNSPTSYDYQWLRCDAKGNGCARLSGATEQSYTVAAADEGHTIVVWVA